GGSEAARVGTVPVTAPTSRGSGGSADQSNSARRARAIGWRRRRFTRTILVMRAIAATVLLAVVGLACRRPARARTPPADAGTVVTVYVAPKAVDRLMGRLTRFAASHQCALSLRTDSAALAEADLVVGESAGRTFEARRGKRPMRRRPRTPRERLAYFLTLQIGWMPTGRDAPSATQPAERPDARAVERQFRDGVARFLSLERDLLPARRHDLFVKNPAFGDLTLPEWLQIHVSHCANHDKQIRARLAP